MYKSKVSGLLALAAPIVLASCGGHHAIPGSFVAVHNAMTASGYAQTGAISEGTLPEGASDNISVELSADSCHTFVVLGDSGVENVDLQVLDPEGEVLAQDETHSASTALQVCPDDEGTHQLMVTMAEGDGGYRVTSWSGSGEGSGGGRGPRGTCERPRRLELGQPTHGETTGMTPVMMAPCARGPAPEVVYEIEVEERGMLRAHLSSNYDGVLYLMRTCGQVRSTVACNDDSPDTSNSRIAVTVDPGTYYLVVDGYGSAAGSYELTVEVAALQELGEVCGEATPLVPGQTINGDTSGRPDYFHSTCAGGSQSGDQVYSLNVEESSRYRVRQTSQHDGSLYIRATCEDPTSELMCNDDFGDVRHSLIRGRLDAGNYFVFTDGYSDSNAGRYTLTADLAPADGEDAPGNTCGEGIPELPLGESNVDTFRAQNNFTASCGGGDAADIVYRLNIESRSQLQIDVGRHEFRGMISVRRTCDDADSEVACGNERSFRATLEPGEYFVVIDGAGADEFGQVSLNVRLEDVAAMERACRSAPMLRPGRTVTGDTQGNANQFQASCAGTAASGDTVYRLRLRRRSYVLITSEQQYDGAIYIRSECMDISSEVACNDDHGDNRHSRIETNLDAGTYYVFMDGFSGNSQGTYNLNVEVGEPRTITPPTPPRPMPRPPMPGGIGVPGGGAK